MPFMRTNPQQKKSPQQQNRRFDYDQGGYFNNPNDFRPLGRQYTDKYNQAQYANLARYQDIKAGYEGLLAGADRSFAGQGNRINEAYNNRGGAIHQDMINRGMTGSTAQYAPKMLSEREKEFAMNDLMAKQNQYSTNVGTDLLRFMERRNEQYPDLNQMMALGQAQGQYGSGGGGRSGAQAYAASWKPWGNTGLLARMKKGGGMEYARSHQKVGIVGQGGYGGMMANLMNQNKHMPVIAAIGGGAPINATNSIFPGMQGMTQRMMSPANLVNYPRYQGQNKRSGNWYNRIRDQQADDYMEANNDNAWLASLRSPGQTASGGQFDVIGYPRSRPTGPSPEDRQFMNQADPRDIDQPGGSSRSTGRTGGQFDVIGYPRDSESQSANQPSGWSPSPQQTQQGLWDSLEGWRGPASTYTPSPSYSTPQQQPQYSQYGGRSNPANPPFVPPQQRTQMSWYDKYIQEPLIRSAIPSSATSYGPPRPQPAESNWNPSNWNLNWAGDTFRDLYGRYIQPQATPRYSQYSGRQ
jgi:hypothetical protein